MEIVKPARIPRKSIRIGIGLQTLAVLVIFILVNYLSFEYYIRRDYSRSQKFALSSQTKRVLGSFKKDVRIIVISSPTSLSQIDEIRRDVYNLLEEIRFSGREHMRIEYVDPTRDLARIRELQSKYRFSNNDHFILLDYDGRVRFLDLTEMAEFDMNPITYGDAPRLIAFRGEQALTSAFIELLHPNRPVLYFLQGHGEPEPSPQSPAIARLCEYIQAQNIKIAPLSLIASDTIPSDFGVLVILSPKFDLDERETAILLKWLQERGRLIVLLDPNAATPRLHSLIKAMGIIPHNDRVLRLVSIPYMPEKIGIWRELVMGDVLPTTEITRRLAGKIIPFPGVTQSLGLDRKLAEKENIQLRPLIQAAEEFWGETDYEPNNPKGVRYEDGKDYGQPLAIAISADQNGVEDDRVEVQTSRLIVVGNAQFAFDASLSPQGLDFLMSTINSLLNRGKLAGVVPKTIAHFALNLTDEQLGRIALFTMVIIPGFVGILGILIWWRRRT